MILLAVLVSHAHLEGFDWLDTLVLRHILDASQSCLVGTLGYALFHWIGKPPTILLLAGALMSVSAGNYRWHQHTQDTFLQQYAGNVCTIRGTVEDIDTTQSSVNRYRMKLKLQEITQANTQPQKAHNRIYIYSRRRPEVQIGDTITITNATFASGTTNSSFKHYLLKEGMSATLFLKAKNNISLYARPAYSFGRWIHTTKERLIKTLRKKMKHSTATIFSTMFLGKKQKSNHFEKTKEQFKQWGISHYLARSGLHLIIFIILWELILRLLPLPLILKHSVNFLLVFVYFLLSWSSISFIRAFITYILYKFFLMQDIQSSVHHILLLVCSIILILYPAQLFFLDFQLSFGLAFTLSWLLQANHMKKKPA